MSKNKKKQPRLRVILFVFILTRCTYDDACRQRQAAILYYWILRLHSRASRERAGVSIPTRVILHVTRVTWFSNHNTRNRRLTC